MIINYVDYAAVITVTLIPLEEQTHLWLSGQFEKRRSADLNGFKWDLF